MTTTVDLLAALCAHLTAFELPAVASVHVAASLSVPQVTVQLTCHEPSVIAQGLLAWADTLTQVTAQAWRVPQGDSVHLSVTGLLPDGASVLVYGSHGATRNGLGADLAPDAATTIPLSMLRHAAIVEEVRA
jgi:FtsP/CotA-like multicopper oxidase with cupredoxin domain